MDTRRGTCGNMAALHVALGWRLGWPVSLALAHWHCVLRFDDGRSVWNIEASNTEGGFRTNPDSYYQTEYNIPQGHIDCGSDLTFLRPRQLLGHFIGARGRHWWDMLYAGMANGSAWGAPYIERRRRISSRPWRCSRRAACSGGRSMTATCGVGGTATSGKA